MNLERSIPATAPWPLPPGVKTVRVHDYPMAYVEARAGVPVILVRGTDGDYRSFAAERT